MKLSARGRVGPLFIAARGRTLIELLIAMTISITINVKPLRFSFISFSVPVPPRDARQNPAAVIPAGFGCFQVEKNHFFSRMKQDKTGTKLSIKW